MPNWCENDLIISADAKLAGSVKDLEKFQELMKGNGKYEDNETVFDFNNVLPYPKKFLDMDKAAHDFEKLREAEIERRGYKGVNEMPKKEREEIFKKYPWDKVKDGYNSGGYDWCSSTWGTKWNACDAIVERKGNKLKYTFNTAWAPPVPVIAKLGTMFPTLKFKLKYYEMGMGFQGVVDIQGDFVSEESSKYSGHRGG